MHLGRSERAKRSYNMSRIRGRDTKPELAVRSLIHGLGYRYRLHDASLPGKPDLVFPGRRKVIFVHGCFWHRHRKCANAVMPATNTEFWSKKLLGNVERDRRNGARLRSLGWKVLVIWECEVRDQQRLSWRVRRFLDDAASER